LKLVSRLRLYVHPTCYSSYVVVKELARRRLLDRIELVDTSRTSPLKLLREGVWSVPWLADSSGEPLATDPLETAEAVSIVAGTWSQPPLEDPVEAFSKAILHSAYATAVTLVMGSPRYVVDEGFLAASLRARLRGIRVKDLVDKVSSAIERQFDQLLDRLRRAAGVSLVRELWWGSNGDLDVDDLRNLDAGFAAAWLIAKASVGRIGLPAKPWKDVGRVAKQIAEFVRRGAAGLIAKVRREWEEITTDEEYWRILDSYATGF
jgi:predicted thioredoxin/glutaredoxin